MIPSKNTPYFMGAIIGLILAILHTGCSSTKEYVNTYADPALKPGDISAVALVVDDQRVTQQYNLLFADTFLKTAKAKKRIPLAGDAYVLKKAASAPESLKAADASLEIALTHCYPGNQSDHFPTSVGAVAKLIDTKTERTLWHLNYAYASPKGGAAAPSVEEAVQQVAEKIVEAVPLVPEKPRYAAYIPDSEPETDAASTVAAPLMKPLDPPQPLKERFSGAGAENAAAPGSVPSATQTPAQSPPAGAYMIHVASVKNRDLAEQFIDRQPADGTVRLSSVVQLNPDRPWYRLLVGRFQTENDARRHIETLMRKGRSGAYAKPMKLPFSLRVSAGRPLAPSRKIVEALRKIDYMAYLSPSANGGATFDVLVGAYENRQEAGGRAQLLLTNGVPVEVVNP